MDFDVLKEQVYFLVMRAHFGTTVDTRFASYWPASRIAGLRTGAYGFLLPNQSVTEAMTLVEREKRMYRLRGPPRPVPQ